MKKEHTVINGTKGVISLFLAILMLPFTIFVGALVNANRVNSAASIFDEALCNAANSTLGTYTPFLKKRFGLLALKYDVKGTLSQNDVQECISGTFSDYMEINCGALSNTFLDAEYQAKGVYPLSDPTVMKGQILQFSKYSVPKQLVEDNFDIDKLVKSFESMIPGYAFFDSIKNIAGTADSCMTYADNISVLKDCADTQDQNYKTYEKAYTEFASAITSYHNAQKALEDAKAAAANADEDGAADSSATTKAETALANAKTTLATKRSAYASAIKALYDSMKKVAEQQKTVNSDTAKIGQNTVDTIVGLGGSFTEQSKLTNEKKLKENNEALKNLEASFKKGEIDSDTYKAQKNSLEKSNQELKDANESLSDKNKDHSLISKQIDSTYQNLTNADKIKNIDHYNPFLANLDSLKTKVDAYDCDSAPSVEKSDYFCDLSEQLLTKADVEGYEDSIAATIAGDATVTSLMAIINFVKALLQTGITYNFSLTAKINTSFYQSNYGGLPSQKDRSKYSLTDTDTTADRKNSEHYKNILNGYFSSHGTPESSNSLDDIGTKFGELFDLLFTSSFSLSGKLLAIITTVVKMAKIVFNLVDCISSLIKCLTSSNLAQTVYQKALIPGYLSIVTPCRTTFRKGTKLTETSSSSVLPGDSSIKDEGLCFRGAEREYLIYGKTDEAKNQTSCFHVLLAVRVLTNVFQVVSHPEVSSRITRISAVPYIGLLLAFIYGTAHVFAESIVDTIVLSSGQKIPLIKKVVYTTSTGLPFLFQDLKGLIPSSLHEALQNRIFEDLEIDPNSNTAPTETGAANTNSPNSETGADASEEQQEQSGILYFTYEQFLFLLMCLKPTDTLLKRFADIVEMEANWDARHSLDGTALFDLDYAYTYVRASGSFRMSEFIPSPQIPGFTSKKRVIYRGY